MDYLEINEENIDKEHICCLLSPGKDDLGVEKKKKWMKERFQDGLVFYRLNTRGKVFIEYIDSENAWMPIKGDNGIHINCLWVSGKAKGNGHANNLLDYCIEDAKKRNKDYISILSSKTKKPFLSDGKFLKYKGFKSIDYMDPYYELLYYPLNDSENKPEFIINSAKHTKDFTIYYTFQCPFTYKQTIYLEKMAKDKGYSMELILLNSKDDARKAPAPFTTFTLFYKDKFITNELISEKKFEKLLDEIN